MSPIWVEHNFSWSLHSNRDSALSSFQLPSKCSATCHIYSNRRHGYICYQPLCDAAFICGWLLIEGYLLFSCCAPSRNTEWRFPTWRIWMNCAIPKLKKRELRFSVLLPRSPLLQIVEVAVLNWPNVSEMTFEFFWSCFSAKVWTRLSLLFSTLSPDKTPFLT